MKKKVLLIGGRSKAKALALSLVDKGYEVTVINMDREDAQKLARLHQFRVIHGDGTKMYMLEEAEAYDCDMAIALTPKDENNLVICELCKKRFGVGKTISLVADPRKREFFHQMGIDSVVCAISAVTEIIEQEAVLEEVHRLIPVADGRIGVTEVRIPEGAPSIGENLQNLPLGEGGIIGCILRGEETLVPQGSTCIRPGDVLVLIAKKGREADIRKVLVGDNL